MDAGMKLMEYYHTEFETLEEQRIEFINSEKLFDMPLADYTEFLRIKNDFEGMQVIYKLYKQQKIAREQWSNTLWSHLNPQLLIDGIENYIKEFRKLQKWVGIYAF